MSYDLVVFEVEGAPRDLQQFVDWFFNKREAAEDRGDALTQPATGRLGAFYYDMVVRFPDMNGPSGEAKDEGEDLAGYEFQPEHIYMDFRWSVSESAANTALRLAQKHGLGLYDLNDAVIFPEDDPNETASSLNPPSFLGRLRAFFGR